MKGYSRAQRVIEAAALIAWAVLFLFAAWRVGAVLPAAALPLAVLATLAAWVAADVLSGLVHWACDTWGTTDWPVVGNGVIRGFREHHIDPLAITRHDFVETNGASALVTLPLVSVAALADAHSPGSVFLLALAGALLLTNQIHRWAHQPRPPRIVGFLQRSRVFLAPEHHAVHHSSPFDRQYCITTGWMDPALASIGFFPALERGIHRVTGALPRSHAASLVDERIEDRRCG